MKNLYLCFLMSFLDRTICLEVLLSFSFYHLWMLVWVPLNRTEKANFFVALNHTTERLLNLKRTLLFHSCMNWQLTALKEILTRVKKQRHVCKLSSALNLTIPIPSAVWNITVLLYPAMLVEWLTSLSPEFQEGKDRS